ncbi:hypothetical protein GGTG_05400 [Gaeumannomyces tritici R3-111a-1]|uniref:Uncharacterized protein n=1 Tax=Gaeumannomyces tritici (strain R3-111a-1) TaxID=644352 RepID=J3NVT8_GAET3|nr:hypothetical protein GGTG_05400 [Gaeumannomyces tritici R3-111a-1]EJT75467.1 hypothetical protein GGTG_05400 [Gaeumannomyces tritici R3-111a-1]
MFLRTYTAPSTSQLPRQISPPAEHKALVYLVDMPHGRIPLPYTSVHESRLAQVRHRQELPRQKRRVAWQRGTGDLASHAVSLGNIGFTLRWEGPPGALEYGLGTRHRAPRVQRVQRVRLVGALAPMAV